MWSRALQCEWDSWLAAGPAHLRVLLPVANVCDMQGTIATAKALDPLVSRIEVYAGGAPLVVYQRFGEDRWQAINKRGTT